MEGVPGLHVGGWMDENVDDYEVALSGAVEYKTEAGQKRLG